MFMSELTVHELSSSTVGRAGPGSVFRVMSKCYPTAMYLNNRNGIVQLHLNQALRGFPSSRMRIATFARDFPQLLWAAPAARDRYSRRRWRNPDVLEDANHIRKILPQLNQVISPHYCSLETCFEVLRRTIEMESRTTPDTTPVSGIAQPFLAPETNHPAFQSDGEASSAVSFNSSDVQWQDTYFQPAQEDDSTPMHDWGSFENVELYEPLLAGMVAEQPPQQQGLTAEDIERFMNCDTI